MAEKTTHLGMAGRYASMAEFLLRGYNVATPVVDIGDDIYVVDDGHGLLRRVQVKTADGAAYEAALAAPAHHKQANTAVFHVLDVYRRAVALFAALTAGAARDPPHP